MCWRMGIENNIQRVKLFTPKPINRKQGDKLANPVYCENGR